MVLKAQFDRWKPTLGKTFAYRIFQHHHSQINQWYWAHRAAFRGAFSLTRLKSQGDPANSVFPNPNSERTFEISLGAWAESYNGFDNWSRLSAIIAIAGYLEVYIKTAVEAACQSCPASMIGGYKEVDGVSLLKTRTKYGFAEQGEACVKGTWQQRASAFTQLFKTCPQVVVDRMKDLERFRELRNSVGHAFGRKLDAPMIGVDVSSTDVRTCSHEALIRYLELAHNVGKAIEDDLSVQYIGSYETIAMYQYWPDRGKGRSTEAKRFSSYFNQLLNSHLGKTYCANLIAWYGGM